MRTAEEPSRQTETTQVNQITDADLTWTDVEADRWGGGINNQDERSRQPQGGRSQKGNMGKTRHTNHLSEIWILPAGQTRRRLNAEVKYIINDSLLLCCTSNN